MTDWTEAPPPSPGRWIVIGGALSLLAAALGASHLPSVAEAAARDASGVTAIPLVAANTTLLYMTASLPLLVESVRRRPSVARLAAFLLLVPALTVLPPLYPRLFPETAFASAFSADIDDYVRGPVRDVRIEAAGADCSDICQVLLLSGMSTVTVAGAGAERTYEMASDDRCDLPSDLTAPISAYARAALLSGRCFPAAASGTQAPAPDATIQIREERLPGSAGLVDDLLSPFGGITRREMLTVTEHGAEADLVRTRATSVDVAYPSFPATVGFADCGPGCAGRPALVKDTATIGAFDREMAVLDAFRLTKPDLSTDRTYSEIVEGMLDASGDAVLTRVQHSIIDDWTRIEHQSPERRDAILLRLVEDQRVVRFDSLARLLAREEFLDRHVGKLVAQMAVRGAASNYSRVIGNVLGRRDLSLVRPYARQLVPVIEASDWSTPFPLARHAGRLGVDTSGLIARRLADPATVDLAVRAACLADASVGEALVPALLDTLSDVEAIRDGRTAEIAVRALSRFGHLSEAKALYQKRMDSVGGRVIADVDPWGIDDLSDYCRSED